ncbi:MAG: hypothetical protein ACI89D_001531 [Bermanella sp.]|jgi:hypothetical protein
MNMNMLEYREENRLPLGQSDCLDIYLMGEDFQLAAGSKECQTLNISKHGLMVCCDSKLKQREQFRLRFHFESGSELSLFGTVRWAVKGSQNRFLMGLKIEDTLGTDYLLWQNRLSRLLLARADSDDHDECLSA